MDKLGEQRYMERGKPIIVNKVSRGDMLDKIDELVEGYNGIKEDCKEIRKIIKNQMQVITAILEYNKEKDK